MTQQSTPVEAGQTREYILPSGTVFGTFQVGSHKEGQTHIPIEWLTGFYEGESGCMHRGSVALCPVVER